MDIGSHEFEELIGAVTNEIIDRIDDSQFWLSFATPDRIATLPGATQRLLKESAENEDLAIFQFGWAQLGGAGWQVQPGQLVAWVVKRTSATSASRSCADLRQYLDALELPVKRRTLITGVTAQREFAIGSGAKFLPRESLRSDTDPILEQEWEAAFTARASFMTPPSGLIETPLVVPRTHYKSYPTKPELLWGPDTQLTHADEVTGLQLTVPGASPLVTWTHVPDWCPLGVAGRLLHQAPQLVMERMLTEAEIVALPDVIRQLKSLNDNTRSAVQLAVDRYSTAVTRRSPVEKAVDLRIAYEVTFSIGETDDPDTRGEFRFRLAQRAARFLGASAEDRRRLFKAARRLYDLCSGAVHSGRLSSDWTGDRGTKTLSEGSEIVRCGLLKIIATGYPDWEDIVLR